MSQLKNLRTRLWAPAPTERATHQLRLVLTLCLGFAGATVGLLLFWIGTNTLEQGETAVAALILLLIFLGIGTLARRGHPALALGVLTGLMLLLVTLDTGGYSIAGTAPAAYVLPILLAALGFGLWPGLGVAGLCAVLVWALGWGEVMGWLPASAIPIAGRLSYNAPALTIDFLLVALVAGLGRPRPGRREN